MLQPQRLGVLVKYGEGPHMSALALIPSRWRSRGLALEEKAAVGRRAGGAGGAGVVAKQFLWRDGAGGVLSAVGVGVWMTRQEKRILIPAMPYPVLAGGVTAMLAGALLFPGTTPRDLVQVSSMGPRGPSGWGRRWL